jgi:hypothetical protein
LNPDVICIEISEVENVYGKHFRYEFSTVNKEKFYITNLEKLPYQIGKIYSIELIEVDTLSLNRYSDIVQVVEVGHLEDKEGTIYFTTFQFNDGTKITRQKSEPQNHKPRKPYRFNLASIV